MNATFPGIRHPRLLLVNYCQPLLDFLCREEGKTQGA